MKKYLTIFQMSLSRMLEFRFDFWAGRLSSFVVLLTNYFLWTTVFADRQVVLGYSFETMVTYALGAAVLFSIVVVSWQEAIGWDIVEGTMTAYLVRPMHYFFYTCARVMAKRLVYFFSTVIVLTLFIPFAHRFFIQLDPWQLFLFFLALVQGVLLYVLLDFLFGISAFWFHRSFGPRWMMEMVLIFTSGLAFPIDIVPSWLQTITFATPFPYLVFFPLNIYLGRPSFGDIISGFIVALVWLCILLGLCTIVWRRGIRRYAWEGI